MLVDELRRRPAHYNVRLTCHASIGDRELSAGQSRFWRRLRRQTKCEYFGVAEWKEGRRHLHAMVRYVEPFDAALVGQLWALSLPDLCVTNYCRPIKSQERTARYMVKLLEAPPESFSGRLFHSSRGFISK